MRAMILAAGLTLLLVGCAANGGSPPSDLDSAAERGKAFAERRCGGCHVVGLDEWEGASGPRFRDLRLRYNAVALQRRFGEISQHGVGEMPPIQISRGEAEDLVAYFATLDR